MGDKKLQELPVRLAMRHEGNDWVAYISGLDNMSKAARIASIRMTLVERPERKQAFLDLMRECMLDMCEQVLGFRPETGNPRPAPENERAGHG